MTTPTYDRELIARMLADYMWPDKIAGRAYRVEAIQKQIDALNAADNADAAGVRTVNTTGPVRALGDEVGEVIADAERMGYMVDTGVTLDLLRRVRAALAQQPEAPAQGVVAKNKWAPPYPDAAKDPFNALLTTPPAAQVQTICPACDMPTSDAGSAMGLRPVEMCACATITATHPAADALGSVRALAAKWLGEAGGSQSLQSITRRVLAKELQSAIAQAPAVLDGYALVPRTLTRPIANALGYDAAFTTWEEMQQEWTEALEAARGQGKANG